MFVLSVIIFVCAFPDTELYKFKCELEADNKGITELLEKRSLELDQPSSLSQSNQPAQHKENRYWTEHWNALCFFSSGYFARLLAAVGSTSCTLDAERLTTVKSVLKYASKSLVRDQSLGGTTVPLYLVR